jgi:hypothetical protein
MTRKTLVDTDALYAVLQALIGPGHLVRELQYTRGLPPLSLHPDRPAPRNPIDVLIENYTNSTSVAGERVPGPPNDALVAPHELTETAGFMAQAENALRWTTLLRMYKADVIEVLHGSGMIVQVVDNAIKEEREQRAAANPS